MRQIIQFLYFLALGIMDSYLQTIPALSPLLLASLTVLLGAHMF